MDENTPANVAPVDTYLEALKNFPKLPDAPVPADEHTADGWCGPESQPDNVKEQEDVVIDLGPQRHLHFMSRAWLRTRPFLIGTLCRYHHHHHDLSRRRQEEEEVFFPDGAAQQQHAGVRTKESLQIEAY
ncbi:hypothetical protein IW261DRAFT_1417623 [Armillaria novae-zelandiae]|uniref:Uncharacterized protein n=1 Tax=Armillaria novae-zelandiae TaxID=153914 RepID=A0AA39ULL8_9AGAR|nr:hypothetical protein IW261DRAFT_1417623 [Armillaria novae-zelandiae]